MTSSPELRHQLKVQLGRQFALILETALSCRPKDPPSPKWYRILQELGVEPISDDERSTPSPFQTKGAPIPEVSRCLDRIVASLVESYPMAREEMGTFLDSVAERYLAQYETLATLPPKVAGGMFANAMATAEKKAAASPTQGASYLLTCPICGAPRTGTTDLVCEFCGGNTTLQKT